MATQQIDVVTDAPPARPAPKPRPADAPPRTGRAYLLAAASAVMLYSAHYPIALGWLAWVALVPFLALVRAEVRPWKRYLAAWLCGVGFFVPVLQWLRVAHPMMHFTWAGLSLYCSLYFPLIVWLLRRLVVRGGWPLALAAPLVWTALEYVRAHLGTGFPWYFVSHTQHAVLPVIQISDVTGAYGVTFLVVAANAVLLGWLLRSPGVSAWLGTSQPSDDRHRWVAMAVLATLLVGTVGYGLVRMDHEPFAEGPRVALVQTDVEQNVRNGRGNRDAVKESVESLKDQFIRLQSKAVLQTPAPDLVVWPETSFPHNWLQMEEAVSAARMPPKLEGTFGGWKNEVKLRGLEVEFSQKWAASLAKNSATPTLLGLNRELLRADGVNERYNTALLVNPDATIGGTYDKMHLVPFGEYVPFPETLPFLHRFTPYDRSYGNLNGRDWARFTLTPPASPERPYRFAAVICYEDTDPYLARQYVRPAGQAGEAPVDFLVNISNDGWFDGTAEHEEHLAICRFRAVECRRAVVRSVNMGISAVIDGDGRVSSLPAPTWAGSKKVEAVVTASVPLDTRGSLYAAWGDWLPAGCGALALFGLVVPFRRRAR